MIVRSSLEDFNRMGAWHDQARVLIVLTDGGFGLWLSDFNDTGFKDNSRPVTKRHRAQTFDRA